MPRNRKSEPEDKELARQIRILAKALRSYREAKKLSQQELASLAKLSTTTIYELESRKVADVRLGTIVALTHALGVRISDLIDAK